MIPIDTSDEASQLPPLDVIEPARSLFAWSWDATQEGLLTFSVVGEKAPVGDTPAVVYLSVRGWRPGVDELGAEAPATWDQVHIGIPREILGDIAKALTAHAGNGA